MKVEVSVELIRIPVIPYSYSDHVTLRNIYLDCKKAFDIQKADDQYRLSDFTFQQVKVKAAQDSGNWLQQIEGVVVKDVEINGNKIVG